ncbi:MAG: winged helix-turn-helix domain-containing protein [Streptosporangiales bacterium]|nr:winged helix-turn-helix domain-containing protein [Streptosporangiales bacterium]
MLRRLGAVQLDTISVLARSHELVPYARLGAVGRDRVESAYWGDGGTFEYWCHAACLLPIEHWPLYGFRRRAWDARGWGWRRDGLPREAGDRVLARLREEGPLTATQLGGAKAGGPWWSWSEVKVAVERLLDRGEVVCVRRTGWRRVYDLPERALPAELLRTDPDDEECLVGLVGIAGRSLGVATRADLVDFLRLRQGHSERVPEFAVAAGLVPVSVAGWKAPAFADPAQLSTPVRGRHRTTLLSPFDSLIWDRARTERIFRFVHRLEAYVPKPERVHGYFAMPLLAGGRLAGRVDPAREGRTLVARQVSLERASAVQPMATALREAADWVGCDNVALEHVTPHSLATPLKSALATLDA